MRFIERNGKRRLPWPVISIPPRAFELSFLASQHPVLDAEQTCPTAGWIYPLAQYNRWGTLPLLDEML